MLSFNEEFLDLYENTFTTKDASDSYVQLLILFDEMILDVSTNDIENSIKKIDEQLKDRTISEKKRKLLSTVREDLLNPETSLENKMAMLTFCRERMESNSENARKKSEEAEEEFNSFCERNNIGDADSFLDNIKNEPNTEDILLNLAVMQDTLMHNVSGLVEGAFAKVKKEDEGKKAEQKGKKKYSFKKNTPIKPVPEVDDETDYDLDDFYSDI